MDCDFLIIGGGIAGLAAGAALAPLGKVLLWERESGLGYHASGRSAALFEAHYGLAETVALNLASQAAHEAEEVMSPRGLMFVGTSAQEAAFAKDLRDLHLTEISEAEARAMVPVLRAGAGLRFGYHGAAWDLDTDRMLQNRAATIRASGGSVQTGHRVTGMVRRPTGWEVAADTAQGMRVVAARAVVNAAGAWADRIASRAGLSPIGLAPLRRSVARIPAPKGVGAWPMMIGAGESWYAKPDAGALIVSPADEELMIPMDAWPEDETLALGIARYQEVADHEVTRLLSSWAGLRSFAPDRRLILGPDPRDSAFIWSAGQGGYGFQTAPAAARLLADLVAGRAPELEANVVSALTPERLVR